MKTARQLYNAEYYATHKDVLNNNKRQKYAQDSETNLSMQHKSYINNRDKRIEGASNYYHTNKDRINVERRARWSTDGEYRTKKRLQGIASRYGITIEEYLELYEQTDGKCAICDVRPDTRALHVDHNHTTGNIRGLLCHHCNTAIGLLKEDPNIISKVLEYLKVHNS